MRSRAEADGSETDYSVNFSSTDDSDSDFDASPTNDLNEPV